MKKLILIFAILNMTDAVSTLALLERGGTEANPVMAAILRLSPIFFVGVKAMTSMFPIVFLLARSHEEVQLAKSTILLVVSVYAILIIWHIVCWGVVLSR